MQWRDELTRRFPKLRLFGAGTYVVGGAIRDLILGREPVDVDIACRDPLAAAKQVRPRVIRLGNQDHLSAWRVSDDGHVYDFAAIEGADIVTDLARRDFTVNAMAVALEIGELLDPHGGQRDAAAHLVRMVDASNFDDDPLRTLKGVRMAVRYDFAIEPATMEAIRARAPRIVEMAAERVTYELSIIFSSNAFGTAVALLQETGLSEALGFLALPTGERVGSTNDVGLAGAYALLVDDPKASARRWRWSDALLRDVMTLKRLIENHDPLALYDAGERLAEQLPAVLRALGRDASLDLPDFSIRPLLDGEAIAALLDLPPGPELGRVKRALLQAQIRGDVRTREEAERFVGGNR